MNTKSGLFVMIGLIAVAVSIPFAVSVYVASNRNVVVKGLCEREVKADRAIWPIVLREGGNDLSQLAKKVEEQSSVINEWLLSSGFSAEEVSVSAPKVENLVANGYSQRTFDYSMTLVLTVCTSNVDLVLDMQTRQFELLNRGIAIGNGNWEYPVVFEYTGLNNIKPEMIELATANAREAADKFASDSGSKVGEIISASQGQFSVFDRDSNTPYIKTVRVVTTLNYRLK